MKKYHHIFGREDPKGKRLPNDLVEVFKDMPLIIATGKDVNLSGTPHEVFLGVCRLDKKVPIRYQYIEVIDYLADKTQLRRFTRKELLIVLSHYFHAQPQVNRNYIIYNLK